MSGADDLTTLDAPTVELVCADVEGSRHAYRRLFDQPNAFDVGDEETVGASTVRLRASSGAGGSHEADVNRVVFGIVDHAATARLLGRRGLEVRPTGPRESVLVAQPAIGIREVSHAPRLPAVPEITGIDHLVFAAATAESAIAVFGGRLGVDFRLQQQIFDGVTQLFFRTASVVIEVVVSADVAPSGEAAALWGIAWRSADLDMTHRRLSDLGVEVSEIREGRKRGTRVATVRDRDLSTRTLVIGD